jgi:hypothetical protein
MISRNPDLGQKLIILNGKKLHVYNPEAKDNMEADCPSEFLILATPTEIYARKGKTLHVYKLKDRKLKPKSIIMELEPDIVGVSHEVQNEVKYIAYAKDDTLKVQ